VEKKDDKGIALRVISDVPFLVLLPVASTLWKWIAAAVSHDQFPFIRKIAMQVLEKVAICSSKT
jgi:hypothetical protein